jgi:hypothetical protein
MRFEPGNKFGKGAPPGNSRRTGDLKSAQRKLQQLLDYELCKAWVANPAIEEAAELKLISKAEKIVMELIENACRGKVQAIEIVLERWAGKPAMVEIEKAYSDPVKVTVEDIGSSPKSESDADNSANPFSTKAN